MEASRACNRHLTNDCVFNYYVATAQHTMTHWFLHLCMLKISTVVRWQKHMTSVPWCVWSHDYLPVTDLCNEHTVTFSNVFFCSIAIQLIYKKTCGRYCTRVINACSGGLPSIACSHKWDIDQQTKVQHFDFPTWFSKNTPFSLLNLRWPHRDYLKALTCRVQVVGIGVIAKYRVKVNVKALSVLWRRGGIKPW